LIGILLMVLRFNC